MGRKIVCSESKWLGERSRLWSPENVYNVLENNKGTKLIEGIFLDMSQMGELQLCAAVFQKMVHLKFIKLYDSGNTGKTLKLQLSDNGFSFLPSQLRLFHWEDYPLKSFHRVLVLRTLLN
ncbi:hypothetical protein CRYUN_Cryun20dG0122500 [Craigia yunnanensis]